MKPQGLHKLACIAIFMCLAFSPPLCFSEEAAPGAAEETIINHYREIVKNSTEAAKVADAHFEIGRALEKLGRETEATAEYLKIIINYPEIKEINKKAEERLARLYDGFSVKSDEFTPLGEAAEDEKSPTIFFAYIKGLYENYINLGQYEKALKILRKLCDLDPENAGYLVDTGNVYLHGYNNADKAIFYFEKALKVNPDNPKAYIDLGKAYEKKGDYEAVLRTYTKMSELFPASPWTMYGLKRAEGIRLARDRRLVRDWYILGPFDNSDRRGLTKNFPPEEKIDLRATYRGKGGASIRWSRPFGYEDSGYVDLNTLISPNDYAVAYALTYVYSPAERKVNFRMGSDSGIRAWLNDSEVYAEGAERLAEADDDIVEATLEKGWNKILLKISETWGSWGFYFRITDLKGGPMEGLIFDPARNEKRLGEVRGRMKKEKRLRITGIALLYTGALSIFLIGVAFMISNVQNRMKINHMKEDFISGVSHELKTPIAAIRMLAETLKRRGLKGEKEKEEYYGMIIKESDRLTRFINKILNFSQLEKGGEIFEFKNVDLAHLARTAAEIYKSEAQDENLEVRLDVKKGPVFAEIDRDAILQVILNLVDNAHKYSGEKKDVTVTVNESRGRAFIEVIDKGPGISLADRKRIFDKFYRVKRSGKGAKGSGLGLAFSKGVVKAHGGDITVESKLGTGSKFTICLPLRR